MLPPEVSKNLDDWLLVEYEERNKTLGDQIRSVQHQLAARGLSLSGAMVSSIVNLSAQELAIRAGLTYDRFLKAADDSGVAIDDDFRSYGRSEIERRFLHILAPELRARASGSMLALGSTTRVANNALSEIDMAADRARRKYQSELDSVISRNKTRSQQTPATASHTINVSGSVGVIQVGSGNSATSFQHIDNSTVTSITEALTALIPEIEALPDTLLPTSKHELIGAIIAGRDELQKAQPNWTVARMLLVGVAGTIQTVAALQPAYQILKGLLGLIGINLP